MLNLLRFGESADYSATPELERWAKIVCPAIEGSRRRPHTSGERGIRELGQSMWQNERPP